MRMGLGLLHQLRVRGAAGAQTLILTPGLPGLSESSWHGVMTEVLQIQEVTWYEGEPPAVLLSVVIWIEDGSQPHLQDYYYLMC